LSLESELYNDFDEDFIMHLFDHVPLLPEDPILGLGVLVKQDKRPFKIDLSIGVYRDEKLQCLPFEVVHEAEAILVRENPSKLYLPIEGDSVYLKETSQVDFGVELAQELDPLLVKAQTLGGTSALFILASFFADQVSRRVWISKPTWPNHHGIFKRVGFEIHEYTYYDYETKAFDLKGMLECLDLAKPKDIVLLHSCCHNPSGVDPTPEQWKQILKKVEQKGLIPLFDSAYQGFGESLEKDRMALQLFLKAKIPLGIAVSHSKNFGLYGERVGALFILCDKQENVKKVQGVIKSFIRTDYSNPPKHGAAVVATILGNKELHAKWEKELSDCRGRINTMRDAFVDLYALTSNSCELAHLKKTKGMFCFTNLKEKEVLALREKNAIYMTTNGRINLCGLNYDNLEIVVDAIIGIKESYA